MTFDNWRAHREHMHQFESKRLEADQHALAADRQGISTATSDAIRAIIDADIKPQKVYATERLLDGRGRKISPSFTGEELGEGWYFTTRGNDEFASIARWVLMSTYRISAAYRSSIDSSTAGHEIHGKKRLLRRDWKPEGHWIAVQGRGDWREPTTDQFVVGIRELLRIFG
ncbi:hypothetical protein [Rathayibacter sp. AY1F3]|uniref:hypothetical protein n=1 Tax=Rathayibacter sp. AY1F3 TaxID=2080558 RepID=UPI0011B06536|nr:hypothetical protein [Rathayibacter sp. AY1F3]